MRRLAVPILITVLLLIPVIALAQGNAIELSFTDGGARVGITDTIESIAAVTVEIDGQQYLLKVPVTIDIDAPCRSRAAWPLYPPRLVGQLGVEILEVAEFTEETEIVFPGYWGGRQDVAPSSEENKLVAIAFGITNVGREQLSLDSYNTKGIDDTGRLFEEIDFSCEDVNPGGSGRCMIVFDVPAEVSITGLDIEITDHRQIAIPR